MHCTKELLQSVGANVRQRRVQSGQTQEQLAEKANMDRRYLQRVERGTVNMTLSTLATLAEVLGTTPTALLRPAKVVPPKVGRPAKRPRRKA